jgi:hypothetical protein
LIYSQVLDTLTESAAQLCEADIAAIIRQKGDAYYWATSYGLPADTSEYIKSNIAIESGRETVAGRVLQEGKTVHVPDVIADREYDAYPESRRPSRDTWCSIDARRIAHRRRAPHATFAETLQRQANRTGGDLR